MLYRAYFFVCCVSCNRSIDCCISSTLQSINNLLICFAGPESKVCITLGCIEQTEKSTGKLKYINQNISASTFRHILVPTLTPIQWISGDLYARLKQSKHELCHSPNSSTEFQHIWSSTSSPNTSSGHDNIIYKISPVLLLHIHTSLIRSFSCREMYSQI